MSFRHRGTLITGALIVAMLLPFGATAQGNDIPVVVDLGDLGRRFGSGLDDDLINTLPTRSRSIMSELENLQPDLNPDAGDWDTVSPRTAVQADIGRMRLLRTSYGEFPVGGGVPALDSNYFLEGALGGDHEIKFGVDYYTADTDALELSPNQRIAYVYRNDPAPPLRLAGVGDPYSSALFDQGFKRISAYVQDTITFGKLSANFGVRYDRSGLTAGAPTTVFDAPQFDWYEPGAGIDVPSAWELITPRIALTYDITGDGKNVVKLAAGRYMSQSGAPGVPVDGGFRYGADDAGATGGSYVPYRYGYAEWIDPPGTGSTANPFLDYSAWDAPFIPVPDVPTFESDYNTPYLDELTLAFEKALTDDLAVSLSGFYKKKHNLANTLDDRGALVDAGAENSAGGGIATDAPFDLGQPGNSNPIANGRNPLIQLMIVDEVGNVLVQVNVGDDPPVEAPTPVTLWSAMTRLFSPSTKISGGALAPAATSGSAPLLSGTVAWGTAAGFLRATMPARARTLEPTPIPVVQQGANGLQVFLTSLGTSSGEAFVMQAFNSGSAPVDMSAAGLVVEPLKEEIKKQVQQQLQQQLSKLIGDNPVTQRLNAYCLEMFKAPPSLDSMFQIASGDLQQQFAPLKHIMSASKALQDVGLLNPDSDPLGYFHSIRQWSIWSKEEGFDQPGFTDAFVEHTKKQVEDAGQQWSPQSDATLRSAAPNRWGDIQRIIGEADRRQETGGR